MAVSDRPIGRSAASGHLVKAAVDASLWHYCRFGRAALSRINPPTDSQQLIDGN